MKISLFKNVSEAKNPEILDLIDYLNDTREGKWQDLVNQCRNIHDVEEKKAFKRGMPTATISGIFTYRNDSSLVLHSDVLAMDLDDVEDLNLIKSKLKKDKYTLSVFMSTGGYGLRWLIKIKSAKHREAFKGAMQYLFEVYGISADTNSSLSKPYIVSYDPDLFIKASYEDVPVFEKYVKETVIKNIPSYIHNSEDFENVYKQVMGRRVNLCENYDDWLKIGFGLAEEFGEGGRLYFHELSQMSEKYSFTKCDKQYTACIKARGNSKINIRTFYYLAKNANISIASEKTKDIIRTTRNGKRAGLKPEQIKTNLKEKSGITSTDEFIQNIFNSDEKDNFEDADESTIHVLEMFIKNSYDLRLNEVSGFFEDQGRIINAQAMNSIYISAKKVLPKLDYNLMIRLLKSDFIASYNPFYEFWGSDGIPVILPPNPIDDPIRFETPVIDKLASTIINDDEAFTLFFLRKWLVSIVSSAHKVHSPLLHCLLGPQHTGKTEFYRRMLPNELKGYYAESKLDKEKDDEILMCEKLVIMDDELGGKTKKDTLKLNNLTSRQYFSLRRPYADTNETLLRLAVLCGTSNHLQILSDPTGNRRIIPTIVKDIDKSVYNSINKKDLFFEMFKLYKAGFDWRITPKDLKLLNKDQEKYTVTIKERELIMRYYEPTEDKDSEKMTTTDIIVELEKLTQQRLDSKSVVRELDELGFIKISFRYGLNSSRVTTGWRVKKTNRFEGGGAITPYTGKQDLPF